MVAKEIIEVRLTVLEGYKCKGIKLLLREMNNNVGGRLDWLLTHDSDDCERKQCYDQILSQVLIKMPPAVQIRIFKHLNF